MDVFGKMITNTASTTVTIDALGRHFVIPADSSFIVSDFSKMVQFFSTAGKLRPCHETTFSFVWTLVCVPLVTSRNTLSAIDFLRDKYNLIVVDPPWENRSAIRSKR